MAERGSIMKKREKERSHIAVLVVIPHQSAYTPRYFRRRLLISKDAFRKYHELTYDKDADRIITIKGRIVFKAWLSRIYCDVERYNYNELREKSHRPALNRHAYDGTELIKYDPVLQRKGIRYIFDYNNRFSKIVQKLIRKGKKIILINCHTYTTTYASHKHQPPYPDVCLGYETDYRFVTPQAIKEIENYLVSLGLNVGHNHPYYGVSVPNEIYLNTFYDNNIRAIMLEINRNVNLLNYDFNPVIDILKRTF
jgi:hypothetical protein